MKALNILGCAGSYSYACQGPTLANGLHYACEETSIRAKEQREEQSKEGHSHIEPHETMPCQYCLQYDTVSQFDTCSLQMFPFHLNLA